MDTIFFWCAIIGGTVLVCQFVMTLLGLGDGEPDFGSDIGDIDSAGHHDSTWFFGVISFRTLVAAITFFGLAGLWAFEQQIQPIGVLLIATAAGVASMFGVYYLMRSLTKLDSEGTLRIERAVGKAGTVYLPIPANNAGPGKIHLKLQNQLVELAAMTPDERLPVGATVVVTGVIGPDIVEVALPKPLEMTAHA